MKIARKMLPMLLIALLAANAAAEQGEEIIKVKKSTFVNLVDLLVKRGVINQEEGSGLVSAAEQESSEVSAKAPVAAAEAKLAPETADSSEGGEKDKSAANSSAPGRTGKKLPSSPAAAQAGRPD